MRPINGSTENVVIRGSFPPRNRPKANASRKPTSSGTGVVLKGHHENSPAFERRG